MSNITETSMANLVSEIKAIDTAMRELEAERETRVAMLKVLAGEATGTHETSEGSFVIRENNRYDQKVMLANLLPGQVKRCSVSKLDSPTVKRLYPEVYEASKVSNGYSLVLK